MPLITRGRLSVQRVPEKCWNVIQMMADKGGWDNMSFEKKKPSKTRQPVDETRPTTSYQKSEHLAGQHDEGGGASQDDAREDSGAVPLPRQANVKSGRKRKVSTSENEKQPRRKSLRSK